MLSKKLETIMNEQIGKEAFSSNLYLAMASWAETQGYEGIANWFYAQAEEEHLHMLKFIRFINEKGGKAILPAIEKPESVFHDVKFLFTEALKHEQFISNSINEIMHVAVEEKDFASQNWLQWFIFEQREEEASVQRILDKLNILGAHNMYLFDRDIMSLRAPSAPAAE
ncbi:MAG: Ferritin [Bacteroidetes bacterium ADurb.Bin408]|nr:MAG: Ferritin [Bacteroidetes bacterium ADurb.Bin408]